MCDYQQRVNLPAKCGVETRQFVPRLYGGYFYNRSLEMGKDCYELVKEAIHKLISPDIEIILKRGCTEFEMKHGASDKWTELPEQKDIETKFNEIFVSDLATPKIMPDYVTANVQRKWLHFAANAKPPDLTYKKFTDGKPLIQECNYVTYHETSDEKFKKLILAKG